MKHYRTMLFGLVASLMILAGGGALVSCHRDTDSLTTPDHSSFQSGDLNNLIIDSADGASWGGQYVKNNAYFMVNIPIAGAISVEYSISGGGTYALFVETTTPTKWEIGLTTVDGVTDTLERVCVTYTEGVAFASKPANSESAAHHAGKATQYLRKLENGGTEHWWTIDAAFAFAGKTQTICVVENGVVQGAVVDGPFPKPMPTPVSTVAASAPSFNCAAAGGTVVPGAPAGTCWFKATATSCDAYCPSLGLTYDSQTCDWGAGGASNCQAIGAAFDPSASHLPGGVANAGCYVRPDTSQFYGGTNGCTAEQAVNTPRQRYCACK